MNNFDGNGLPLPPKLFIAFSLLITWCYVINKLSLCYKIGLLNNRSGHLPSESSPNCESVFLPSTNYFNCREAIHVPFMARFVVYAKRTDELQAQLRMFCVTDDKEDKTLERIERFIQVAKSRDVEVC